MVSAFLASIHALFPVAHLLKNIRLRSEQSHRLPDAGPGCVWLRSDDARYERTPDQNGKMYRFHRLLPDGPHAGMYTPVFYLKMGPTTDALKAEEARDILDSGLCLSVLDRSSMSMVALSKTA